MSATAEDSTDARGERRRQWRRVCHDWHNQLIWTTGEEPLRGVNFDDPQSLKVLLRDYHTRAEDFGWQNPDTGVDQVLTTAFESLQPFTDTIRAASRFPSASALVWIGVLSIVMSASDQSKFVAPQALDLITDLCDCIPSLEKYKFGSRNKFQAFQYALQDLLNDYLHCGLYASNYFRRARYENSTDMSTTSMSTNIVDTTRSRIERGVERLEQAAKMEEEKTIRDMTPADIAAMPDNSKELQYKYVEFPVNTVKKARNNAFVGREELLERLDKTASTPWKSKGKPAAKTMARQSRSGTPPTLCVLNGLDGIGKTSVALEYYYQHRADEDYDACFWVESQSDWAITTSFAAISDKLNLLDRKTIDQGGYEIQSRAIDAARIWLQETEHRWLLIFDNVSNFADLDRYLPIETHSNGTVIITTHKSDEPPQVQNCHMIPVEPLGPDAATACLFRYLNRKVKDDEEVYLAHELVEFVGRLPLAIATVGGYINQVQVSLRDFWDELKQKDTIWQQAERVAKAQYLDTSLRTVFLTTFESLGPPDRELLFVFAFLNPDSVPDEIFHKALKAKRFTHIRTDEDLKQAYYQLRSRQLIKKDTSENSETSSSFSIHRTVQWTILSELSSDEESRGRYFRLAFDCIAAMLPKPTLMQKPTAEDWKPYALYGRQFLELRSHCMWPKPSVEMPLEFGEITAELSTYLWYCGKFPDAMLVLETAQQIIESNPRKQTAKLQANVHAMQGIITSYEGVSQRGASMKFRRKARQDRDEDVGSIPEHERSIDDNIKFWQMESDLAFGYIQEEDFEETAKLMRECIKQYKKWNPDELELPFEYAKWYWLMPFCYLAEGEALEAIRGMTRCHELMQAAAGSSHPMSLLIKFCYGMIQWHIGYTKDALATHKAVLEHRRSDLGEFSQFTLESFSTCGKLCFEAGETEKAREYLTTCLERRKRATWNEEGVTRAQFRYVKVLRKLTKDARDQNKAKEADSLEQEADRLSREVSDAIKRYRENYKHYMPPTDDEESNLDQMVSFWAGRFTGRLKQPDVTT